MASSTAPAASHRSYAAGQYDRVARVRVEAELAVEADELRAPGRRTPGVIVTGTRQFGRCRCPVPVSGSSRHESPAAVQRRMAPGDSGRRSCSSRRALPRQAWWPLVAVDCVRRHVVALSALVDGASACRRVGTLASLELLHVGARAPTVLDLHAGDGVLLQLLGADAVARKCVRRGERRPRERKEQRDQRNRVVAQEAPKPPVMRDLHFWIDGVTDFSVAYRTPPAGRFFPGGRASGPAAGALHSQ